MDAGAARRRGLGVAAPDAAGQSGTGYWNRDRDELLLIGTRGKVVAPAMGEQGESVFAARPPLEGRDVDPFEEAGLPTRWPNSISRHAEDRAERAPRAAGLGFNGATRRRSGAGRARSRRGPGEGGGGMTRHRTFHYVNHHAALDWLRLGWIVVRPYCAAAHLDFYGVTMEWLCDCKMVKPQ
jgi:hypothetical protein